MKRLINRISKSFNFNPASELADESAQEYVEIGADSSPEGSTQIMVRPYTVDDFSDIKPILDSLREGYTIALINIRPLKDRDIIELKRVINKLKKTCDAIEGDIAGFGDDYIVVTPGFAKIFRDKAVKPVKEEKE